MRMGKNMTSALAFAMRYEGWHTYNEQCRATVSAVVKLVEWGIVEVNAFGQFRMLG